MIVDQLEHEFETIQADIANGPIVPNVTAEEIRTYLHSRYDFKHDMALEDVVADVETMLRKWQVQVTHPRYFGLFNPSVSLASVVADTLVAIYNPQLANWRTSPAANEIERHTLTWLAGKFGLPKNFIATFTSGGVEANLSAVVVALTHAFPEYGEHGLRHVAAQPTVYLTREAHHGFNKIAHIIGLGRQNLRLIPSNQRLQMDLEELARCVAQDRRNGLVPFMVVASAGTTGAGIIDPLPDIARFCQDERLWYHVDAAWGGAAIVSPALSSHLAGIEHADSITCDAHKWFSVPMGCGMFFCRHPEAVAQAFRADVSYMPGNTPDGLADTARTTFDPLATSVQWSRRFIGLKLFMSLAQQGETGYAEMIEHQARMCDFLRLCLTSSGWQVVNSTPLPVVCFTREGLQPSVLLAAMREQQTAWMSETEVGGINVMRACITSFRTTEEDIQWVVEQMNQIVTETGGAGASENIIDEANRSHAGHTGRTL